MFLHPNSNQLENLVEPHTAGACPVLKSDDTALLIYTSGTTGRPKVGCYAFLFFVFVFLLLFEPLCTKGAELTHGNLAASLEGLRSSWEWRAEDVLLHVLPLYHLHGLLVALHGALYAGSNAIVRLCIVVIRRKCAALSRL